MQPLVLCPLYEGINPPPPIFLGLMLKRKMIQFALVKNVLRSVKLKVTIWKS